MSKKKLLLYKKYYCGNVLGKFLDNADIDLMRPQRSFAEVIKNLIERKYIHLTKTGYYHLLPKGVFVHEAIIDRAQKIMELDGAVRYRFASVFSPGESPAIQSLIAKFEDQIFNISTLGENTLHHLKYASDPLIFQYFSGRNLKIPFKIYSPDYFFRAIKTGELKPLIQPREFYMTDFHYFYEHDDFDAYIKASLLNKAAVELFVGENNWHLNIDTNIDFFNSNKQRILKMLDSLGVNAVINITKEKTHYYSIQNQYIVNYFWGNSTQLANLQFDQKNGELFEIKSSATKKSVSIIHGTIFGRIEKIIALVFGKQIEVYEKNDHKPVLPIWLSPIIVRIIPLELSGEILKFSENLGEKLSKMRCRYDIDLRKNSPLNKKIKTAEQDWVPFEVVIGDNEIRNNTLSVRNRSSKTAYSLTVDSFLDEIAGILKKDSLQEQATPHVFLGDDQY